MSKENKDIIVTSDDKKISKQDLILNSQDIKTSSRGLVLRNSSASTRGALDTNKKFSQTLKKGGMKLAHGSAKVGAKVVKSTGSGMAKVSEGVVSVVSKAGDDDVQTKSAAAMNEKLVKAGVKVNKAYLSTPEIAYKTGHKVGQGVEFARDKGLTRADKKKAVLALGKKNLKKGSKNLIKKTGKKTEQLAGTGTNKVLDSWANADDEGHVSLAIKGSQRSIEVTKKGIKVIKGGVKGSKKAYRGVKRFRAGKSRRRRFYKRAVNTIKNSPKTIARGSVKIAKKGASIVQGSIRGLIGLVQAIGGFLLSGGWIPIVVILIILGTFIVIISSLFAIFNDGTGSLNGREKAVASKLMSLGYDKKHTAGIMGNLICECGLDFSAYEGGGKYADLPQEFWSNSYGYGACQWTEGRKISMCSSLKAQGKLTSDDEQLAWMSTEAPEQWYCGNPQAYGVHSMSWDMWKNDQLSSADFLAMGWAAYYERCASGEAGHLDKRKSEALRIYSALMSGGDGTILGEAKAIASDKSHGYSQERRFLNPDVDCSSFVFYACKQAGCNVGDSPFSTYNMGEVLKSAGFNEMIYTGLGNCLAGDILVSADHTEIFVSNQTSIGAHQDYDGQPGDSTGREVCEGSACQNWSLIYRKQ